VFEADRGTASRLRIGGAGAESPDALWRRARALLAFSLMWLFALARILALDRLLAWTLPFVWTLKVSGA